MARRRKGRGRAGASSQRTPIVAARTGGGGGSRIDSAVDEVKKETADLVAQLQGVC